MILRLIIMVGILVGLDVYVYQSVRTVSRRWRSGHWFRRLYWWIHLAYYAALLGAGGLALAGTRLPARVFFYLITFFVLLYVPKLVAALVLLAEDVVRLGRWLWRKVRPPGAAPSAPASDGATAAAAIPAGITRAEFISLAGLTLAGLPFASIVYGIVRQKYDFTVREVTIPLSHLPAALDGLTIAQISDIHVGSFDSRSNVADGIAMVNDLGADLICFTGDLVNNLADEMEPYLALFARLRAREGVFSVLGNHDYGDYIRWWRDPEEKAAHFQRLLALHERLNWRLLRNENVILERQQASLAVIGVENWSARRGFASYGDLSRAVQGTEAAPVKLLLSHDPTHWDAQIRPVFPDIDLTLSGHTHGFQFGVEIPGFKWSPVQYVYRQWAGVYQENGQYLYVNRGFGFIGFMGRVGISPEITLLRLVRPADAPSSATDKPLV
ncbi:MAG: metallophosphoesterase [Acidobacteria bacterium]|nr:metallophosphoesterase [Acidobacteriota bacterium]